MFIKFLALMRDELGELAKGYQWCLLGGLEGLQAYRQWNTNYIANHDAIPSKEFIQQLAIIFAMHRLRLPGSSCLKITKHYNFFQDVMWRFCFYCARTWLTARMDANAEKCNFRSWWRCALTTCRRMVTFLISLTEIFVRFLSLGLQSTESRDLHVR